MYRALTICASLLALGACSTRHDDANTQAVVGTDNQSADLTPEGPSMATRLFGGGKPMPLDIQQQAANGMIVYLSSIQAKPTETVVAVKVVNGFERDVQLNWSNQNTFLTAGGQKFFVSPPLENKELKVAAGATMQGDLVFLGRLPKGVPVALVFNDGLSNSQYSGEPNLSIPIPVNDTAFTDDGSKKNSAA